MESVKSFVVKTEKKKKTEENEESESIKRNCMVGEDEKCKSCDSKQP